MLSKFNYLFYGALLRQHVHDSALAVCDIVGHGQNHTALQLLLGTAAQETLFGTLRDATEYGAGVGLCQCDLVAFQGVQARTPEALKQTLKEAFGVDLDQVVHRELAFSPLLALLWCRLHYRLIPEPIPADVAGMARYWKKYYNTSAGKGTEAEFIVNYSKFVG